MSDFDLTFKKWGILVPEEDWWDDYVNDELTPLSYLKEKDTKWVLEIDLPQVSKKDININATSRHLVIEAKLDRSYCISKLGCKHEFNYFKKSIPLPVGIDQKNISAKFDRGVLTISIPKILSGKKIQIE